MGRAAPTCGPRQCTNLLGWPRWQYWHHWSYGPNKSPTDATYRMQPWMGCLLGDAG